jgi:fructose-1,6-bisphosphatase/inositol monophosphatase family enzyme
MLPHIEAVTGVIEEAARRLVLPRFARLTADEIIEKSTPGDADDLVTVVDREVEAHLTRALPSLAPAAVLGEEAAHKRPELLRLLESDQPLWLIDPIDGTKNFVAGDPRFGIMVAYVVDGSARAAWIVLPARSGRTSPKRVAGPSSTASAFVCRKRPAWEAPGRAPRPLYARRAGGSMIEALEGRAVMHQPAGCAAVEYTDIVGGRSDFAMYYRLLPWDHAAPALVLDEAGGCVTHVDGRSYTARSGNQLTLVARDMGVASQLGEWIRPLKDDNR